MQCAPALFLPAPFHWIPGPSFALSSQLNRPSADSSDVHFIPHYPTKSPVEEMLRFAAPGSDAYVNEGYAAELSASLRQWGEALRSEIPASSVLNTFVDSAIQFTSLKPNREVRVRPGDPIEVVRREFSSILLRSQESFASEIQSYFQPLQQLETADFEIYECSLATGPQTALDAKLRYEFVGTRKGRAREQRIGAWSTRWSRDSSGKWKLVELTPGGEDVSRASGPFFVDVTSIALGQTESYKRQLLRGSDYWRTVLDGAIGVDVYGNNGIAVGDFDNDGFDDLYVCQPAGLPNRLYRNRGEGTFEDVTEKSGLGVLDFTACALFADFQNRGVQDLLVVCATGPLLFVNDGNGRFNLKRDAFQFARPPQGSFTHAAVADFDRDGRLDVYFCLYSYYQGLDQYRYPAPYFDARNGPPNYLFHNQGNGTFRDVTEPAGLNIENDRYSFACAWGDSTGDGWPDLYVVNDFGRNCLYRNNRDGTFATVSTEAHVNEPGAGMSACWLDFDNDGKQDIYAAGMWVAAGMRIFNDPNFHPGDPPDIRAHYHRHMTGNSLYRNQGDGKFQNLASHAGVDMGRWSWSTDSWDFDHDGYPDLYVTNGYISSLDHLDVSSFFWRQVVANSPVDSVPSAAYERGWDAMNELIRSDATWNGRERNVFFANNRDGTFSDISGLVGLDFRDDSRAFALADLDGDGRLEIVLKNRNAAQLRVLRLASEQIGNSITFRLRGTQSNRDAIGSAVTVEAGSLRQTKYLQAGSGFLSQHTKELCFGLGQHQESVRATVRWPNGSVQSFNALPINHRIEIQEGASDFRVDPFRTSPKIWAVPASLPARECAPDSTGTWLIQTIKAPHFSLPDLAGNLRDLKSLLGGYALLNFWTRSSSICMDQLRTFQQASSALSARARLVTVNVDEKPDLNSLRTLSAQEKLSFPILLADQDVTGVYNLVYRYMLDRHRDLPLPTSFLLDHDGNIVKLYQGLLQPDTLVEDIASAPSTPEDRVRKALPFPGLLVQDSFQRNAFTYGVAFFQHGFLDEAEESFQQAIADKPDDPQAYYNLGTLFLRQGSSGKAKEYLEKALKLRPNYPEAWNNLGMLAAQAGNDVEAIHDFQQSLQQRATYVTALLNLGNLYRRQGNLELSEDSLEQALRAEPGNPEVNYNLGMLYARKQESERALQYLQKAIALRPDYADALNNLGVMFVQLHRNQEAEQQFRKCIQQAPDFDQAYLNLARLYAVLNEKEKAQAVLKELLARQPQHKMAQQMLQMLY
jgi:Flp pilus assembly protein TadD/peroxiredoxin